MRNSTQYQYFPFVECLLELATEDSQQKEQANADQQPGVSKSWAHLGLCDTLRMRTRMRT